MRFPFMRKQPVKAAPKNFKEWYMGMPTANRAIYVARAGTTRPYVEIKLIHKATMPKRKLLDALVEASDGQLTLRDLLDFFYSPKEDNNARTP